MKNPDPYKHLREKYHASEKYQNLKVYQNQYHMDTYNKRKELGICVSCGKRAAQKDRVMCPVCLEKRRKANNPAPYERRKRIHQERKSRGVCVACGKEYQPNGTLQCDSCNMKRNDARVKYTRERNKCHDCGLLSLNYRCKECERKWRLKNL